MNRTVLYLMLSSVSLASCSSEPPPPVFVVNSSETARLPAPPPPPPPEPNYVQKEGNIYRYTSAPSEDDKKAGRITGDVVSFRYLGKKDGVYTLGSLDDNDVVISRYQCTNPCKIIVRNYEGTKTRTPFNPESVGGSAFVDAFNGLMAEPKPKS